MTRADPARVDRRTSLTRRLMIAALVLLVGALAVRHSLGLALSDRNPKLALRLDGENAFARADAARALVRGSTDPADRRDAYFLARSALARDAGNVTALASLGMASDDAAEVTAAFNAAARLSRRDLPTQLWLIETAVARGDVVRALTHYDIALRTNRSAPSVLFPVLVEAASDGKLRPEIARILSNRPLWGGLYLQQLAQSGDRQGAADLFALLKRRGIGTGDSADAALYARLMEVNAYDIAWRVYAATHPGIERNGVRNPRFAEQPLAPTPFDWQVSDNEFVNSRIEHIGGHRGNLVFATAAGEGGEAARQLLVLQRGSYLLEVMAGPITLGDGEPPSLAIVCRESDNLLVRRPLAANAAAHARFTVPAGCVAQTLTLTVPAASSLGTVEGAIRQLRIIRAG